MLNNKRCFSFAFATAIAAVAFSAVPARAGMFDDDEARRAILELRGKIDSLQREVSSRIDSKTELKADKNSVLDLSSQNDLLRQDIARLRGQIEVLTNELANTQQRQKDFYVDLDTRLRKLEPQKITIEGKESSVDPAEQKAYENALGIFKAGDYRTAGAGFFDFLRRYPQSGYAPLAQYWLGNTYYLQRDYRNTVSTLQTFVRNYPDNPKVPDAYLSIANSQQELKDKSGARRTLDTLIAQFPETSAARTAKERLSALK